MKEKKQETTQGTVEEIKEAIKKKGAKWVAEETELTELDAEEKGRWLGSVPEPEENDKEKQGR